MAIPVVTALAQRFPNHQSISLDKGFHSPANQKHLAALMPLPVLPKKGNATAARRETDPAFRDLRRRHAAVASAINALAAYGYDRFHDHGLDGFKCYVALAVVGRKRDRLGALLFAAEAERWREAGRQPAMSLYHSQPPADHGGFGELNGFSFRH